MLASYSDYTAGHLPQTMTDAAGQVTQTTYNAVGQVLTVTNAKQETTTYSYDANGYLQSVTGPVTGATVTYTYDGYGRLRSATPAGEAAVVTEYDALNRPTRTTAFRRARRGGKREARPRAQRAWRRVGVGPHAH